MEKAVILLSGGLDSSTLLYQLNSCYECYPLTLLYGQRHSIEIMAARNVCESLGREVLHRWKLVDLNCLRDLLPSALTGTLEVPEGKYDDPTMSLTVVPGRNLIFLAVASGYAQGLGAKFVAYAAHSGDHPIYPDCRPEFIEAASRAMKIGYNVDLLAPFSGLDKGDIVVMGTRLGVPYFMAYTCYKGGDKHCGYCGACDERKGAFIKAGVKDPTVYEEQDANPS